MTSVLTRRGVRTHTHTQGRPYDDTGAQRKTIHRPRGEASEETEPTAILDFSKIAFVL